ncbi:hypothetical protein LINGRAHAP2_LOCUS21367 [Linum grandiflorum]
MGLLFLRQDEQLQKACFVILMVAV